MKTNVQSILLSNANKMKIISKSDMFEIWQVAGENVRGIFLKNEN